jgi:tetratricopeptide (TPR) repeat protein
LLDRSWPPAITAIAALLVCNVSAHAASAEAARQFQSGNSAFQAQDYAKALEAFEAALAAGQSGPAVHFNIGVAAFRLGDYLRAQAAFEQVARTPAMAALAHYNQGLVALGRGDSDDAIEWFTRAERETSDERLRSLASAQLTDLLPQPPVRNWVGYGALGAGYDDNVALINNSDVLGISGKEDSFAELQLALSAPLARPWRLDGGLSFVDYQDLDSFDQLSVYGGGHYRVAVGDWMNQVGLQLAYTTLDGEGFENRRTLALQTSSDLSADWKLRARYRFNDIDGLNEFTGVSGHRHEASARMLWAREPWDVGIEYQVDISDYDDATLSATRHQLGVDLQRPLFGGWTVMLEASRRHSRYDDASNGSEDRTQFALGVAKILTAQWRLVIRYAHTDNDADRADYNYGANRISAGVEATM